MAIKLEVGKYYKDRNGDIIGPLRFSSTREPYPFIHLGRSYKEDGSWAMSGDHHWDLIEEVPKPLKLEVGKYYKNRGGEIIGPIELLHNGSDYCYVCDTLSYREDGVWSVVDTDNLLDLIEEADPPVGPKDKNGLYGSITDQDLESLKEKFEKVATTAKMYGLTMEDFVKIMTGRTETPKFDLDNIVSGYPREEPKAPKTDKLSPGIEQIPFCALERIGAIFAEGEPKYGRDNWKKDPGNVEYNRERLRHALRHLHLYAEGDTSEDHLAKVAWFCVTTIWRGNNAQT